MTESLVTGVLKDAITTALTVAAPLLIAAVVIGLIISILQATTQINEQTLTFLPKLLGMAVIGLFLASWMIHKMNGFTERIFELISNITT